MQSAMQKQRVLERIEQASGPREKSGQTSMRDKLQVLSGLRTSIAQLQTATEVGPVQSGLPTGIDALDALLPYGGLPRGHVTEVVGTRGSGRTSFLLSMVARLADYGERSAIVDLEGTLDPAAVTQAGVSPGSTWVVMPDGAREGLWATDLLLRSGHFGLVAFDGGATIRLSELVRLQRVARDTQTTLLLLTQGAPVNAPGSLQLRFRILGVDWSCGAEGGVLQPDRLRFAIQVDKGRGEASAQMDCVPLWWDGAHPHIADRRPAAWTEARDPDRPIWPPRAGVETRRSNPQERTRAPGRRRCAEPPRGLSALIADNDADLGGGRGLAASRAFEAVSKSVGA